MSEIFYKKWEDLYYRYFDVIFDRLECVEANGGEYPETKRLIKECQDLSNILSQCNNIISVAAKNKIHINHKEYSLFDDLIEKLKKKVISYSEQTNTDETTVFLCDDKERLAELLLDAESLHTSIREYFIPLFLNVISDYQKDIASVSDQIKEARNLEVINSISKKFRDEKSKFGLLNVIFITAIIVTLILLIVIVMCNDIGSNLESYQLVFFYIKRFSILMLFGVLLTFLFRLRKENFRLSQEYRHKEVLASSFINFQEQIDKMPETVKEKKQMLNIMLFEETIRELGKNPASVLDKPDKEFIDEKTTNNIVSMLFDKLLKK
ncbi:hypothetical protein P9J70_03345 [Glaesserella parasuis]|uniref:hypothetical protein n=1 Tax=Glaesserella parasuis TaxID=738 RepID=UPI0024369A41|nr:hypothetical protein [Glaesserella parasuis]MDG6230525.1 hypothetical protein [Glaesserella parasuis]